MIASSATAGQPVSPSHAGQLALVHLRALGEPRLLRVLGDDAVERLDVLQRPAHQHGVGDALAVVGEHPDPGGGVGHRAELGEPLARQPDRDRADRVRRRTQPASPAEPPDLLDDAGGVRDRVGVGHRVHRGEAAERRGAACRTRPSRRPRGRARAGGCAGRPGRAARPARRRRRSRSPGASRPAPIAAIDAVVEQQVGRLAADGRTPVIRYAGSCGPPSSVVLGRRRAAGRARPSGRPRRW